jgi:hypothetical protein
MAWGQSLRSVVKIAKDNSRSFDSPPQKTEKRLGPRSLRMTDHFLVMA